MEINDHNNLEIHTVLNVTKGRELVLGPSLLEVLRSSRTISTANRFCNEIDSQLNLQDSQQICSLYLWLCPLFQLLEQKASKETYYTINKINLDEQQLDFNDTDRV